MREPEPPTVRPRARTWDRMREFPALLVADRGYMFFMIAQTCATAGRIAVPFYVLFARHIMPLTGANIGMESLFLLEGDSLSNLVWGTIGDRFGFRASFIGSMRYGSPQPPCCSSPARQHWCWWLSPDWARRRPGSR